MLMVMAAVVVMALVVVHDSELLSLLLFLLFFPFFFVDMGFFSMYEHEGTAFQTFLSYFFCINCYLTSFRNNKCQISLDNLQFFVTVNFV